MHLKSKSQDLNEWSPNTLFQFFHQMLLNIKHILWLYCLCEAAAATGKLWMSKCLYLS